MSDGRQNFVALAFRLAWQAYGYRLRGWIVHTRAWGHWTYDGMPSRAEIAEWAETRWSAKPTDG